ncbi:hypothetical protein M758_UG011000 [Ceratodon purpureus]|nr:hypothetical protein M758_UG011000 [Ceratodon purpureus]
MALQVVFPPADPQTSRACQNHEHFRNKVHVIHIHGIQSLLMSDEPSHYSSCFNITVHIVVGTGGRALEPFGPVNTTWSNVKNDQVNGLVKPTSSDPLNYRMQNLIGTITSREQKIHLGLLYSWTPKEWTLIKES